MKKLAVALLVGALGGGLCLAQTASSVSSSIDGLATDSELFFMNSLHYDTTFCNYENEYDFFFQPWELPDIQFDRTGRLGNNHGMSSGGYKALYWAQFANNNVWNSGSSSGSLDVLTAASLFHAGPGLFGVAAAISGSEDKTSVNGVGTSDDSTDVSELYLTWGMNATDNIAWGVSLDIFDADTDSGVSPNTTSEETSRFLLKGGVKFQNKDDFWWSVRALLGQPDVKFDDSSGPSSSEADGSVFGIGADVNWVLDAFDLEVNGDLISSDYDVDDVSAGVNFYSSDDVTEDMLRLQGRASYKIGRAELWKSLKIVSASRDVDLVQASGSVVDKFEVDEMIISPSAAIRFPFGCRECSVRIAGIVGAGWDWVDAEETQTFSTTEVKNEFTDSQGGIRLGLEVVGERFAFDAMWESSDSSSSSASNEHDNLNNDRFVVGATVKL